MALLTGAAVLLGGAAVRINFEGGLAYGSKKPRRK